MRSALCYTTAIAALIILVAIPFAQPGYAQSYQVLHPFTGGSDGGDAYGSLARAADGSLFGTTMYGGGCKSFNLGCGVVFRIGTEGKESVLYAFQGESDGSDPNGVILGDDGNLYGTTPVNVFKLSKSGKLTVLYTFTGGWEGEGPAAGVIRDAEGNLYGITIYGGGGSCITHTGTPGCGTVFKVDGHGKKTVLYRFTGGTDGMYPAAGLIQDTQGNLYGTTELGGDLTDCPLSHGCGTVFRLSHQRDGRWKETVLYAFKSQPDAAYPQAPLIRDRDGNLYGTATEGGVYTWGAVFELSKTGNEKLLYSFCGQPNCADGATPYAPVIFDATGNLYGTTYSGGEDGNGTVFKLSTAGTESVLFKFSQGPVGWYPYAGVIRDADGHLYGTTVFGGDSACQDTVGEGCGVVFQLTP